MPKLIVTTRAGEQVEIDAVPGSSVMEAIRDAGLETDFAFCGGACSCASCHVYLDPALAETLPAPSEAERELLDGSNHPRAGSRLSCQIAFSEVLDGMKLEVAPSE